MDDVNENIEALDLTLIRERLRGTPEQRVQALEDVRRVAADLREAEGRRANRRPRRRIPETPMPVDLAAIRRMLALTPTERIQWCVEQVRELRRRQS